MDLQLQKTLSSELASGVNDEVHCDAGPFDVIKSCVSPSSSKSFGVSENSINKDAEEYKMDHAYRGMALIFDHTEYQNRPHLKRIGAYKDAKKLKSCFDKMGFETRIYNDCSRKKLLHHLTEASKEDHRKEDAFVVAVLTHGERESLEAYDKPYPTGALWEKFSADNCPSLAAKPKLFFIQACQGHKHDYGKKITHLNQVGRGIRSTQTDCGDSAYTIPAQADFLIVRATVPDHVAHRYIDKSMGERQGAWFISALCNNLEKLWADKDIFYILTMVNKEVALEFESAETRSKQVPSFDSRLTRILRFTPKMRQSEEYGIDAVLLKPPQDFMEVDDNSTGHLTSVSSPVLNNENTSNFYLLDQEEAKESQDLESENAALRGKLLQFYEAENSKLNLENADLKEKLLQSLMEENSKLKLENDELKAIVENQREKEL